MESAARPRVIRFGVFEVDLRSDELFKDGHKIKIQELPFQILAALLEHPGEVVTREELQHRLWPQDNTFVDFDHSLNTAVRLLRLALGDSAENPRFIETLPRKGYRFIYPVESIEPGAHGSEQTRHPLGLRPFETSGHPVSLGATEPLNPPPLSTESTVDLRNLERHTKAREATELKTEQRPAWAVVTLGVLLVTVGIVYWMSRRGAAEPEPTLVPVPFTAYPGRQWNPSFSSDGSQVAFAWNGVKQDNWDIYIKQIGSESPRRLTLDPRIDGYPAWSPDGQFIAFLSDLGRGNTAVMIIPANGGRARQLAELPMLKVESGSRLLCWHPGGKWLAVACDQESTEVPSAIYLLSSETGERRRLTSPPKGARVDTNPAFSPDGRSLAFARYFFGQRSEIYLLPVSAHLLPEVEPKQLTFLNQDTCFATWMPDGKEIIFASGSKGYAWHLWRMSVSGSGQPRPLSFSGQAIEADPAISLEKHRLVYTSGFLEADIWSYQIPHGMEKGEPPKKLLASIRVQEQVQYSPDGKVIAYIARASGNAEIWICERDGSNPLQLTHLGGPAPGPFHWSPDGQNIIFALPSRGKTDLYLSPAQGGVMRQLTHTSFYELDPSFSRNGKWIYFVSDRSGDFQVWKIPADGGDAIQVTRKGGSNPSHPQESVDGKMLFYLKQIDPDYYELWEVSMEGGEERRILERVLFLDFEIKEHGIYYASQPGPNGTPIFFYDFANRKTKPIAMIQNGVGAGLTVSPDEQELLYVQEGEARINLMLVENFK